MHEHFDYICDQDIRRIRHFEILSERSKRYEEDIPCTNILILDIHVISCRVTSLKSRT